MTIVLYTNIISPHQLPLAREIAKRVGENNFRYIYTESFHSERANMGWTVAEEPWIIPFNEQEARAWLDSAAVLYSGLRDLDLLEQRAARGLKTFYCSERWFKPIRGLPGWIRLLFPKYRAMMRRFVAWANTDPNAKVLAIGPWAQQDFIRMEIKLDKICLWAYYVEPSVNHEFHALPAKQTPHKFLWVGRLLGWKRVEDIVRAVSAHAGLKRVEDNCRNISLTIVGDGPEKKRLQKLTKKLGLDNVVAFLPSQPIGRIRELMREHDCYILSSNGYEGWGAVVSEALEEGMSVLGTYESGSCPTLLPPERLYHAGDWHELACLINDELNGKLPKVSIGGWSAARGAERFLEMCK